MYKVYHQTYKMTMRECLVLRSAVIDLIITKIYEQFVLIRNP